MRRPASAAALFAAAALVAAAVAWRALWLEPRRTRVKERTLRLPRWPQRLDGLRVAVVSDLHTGAPHVGEARLAQVVEAVQAQRPDLVVLLGDFIDPHVRGGSPVEPHAIAGPLRGLHARHGVFAVLGNHDWQNAGHAVAAALRDAGIRVLENEAVAAGPVHLAGMADLRTREPDVAGTLRDVPDGAPVIVLSHDPDLFPQIPDRVALTLSGHTHGGQVAVPFLRRRVIPSRFGERYARGHVEEGGRHLYVTAGLGTSGWPVRLLAPGEIVLLTLRAAT